MKTTLFSRQQQDFSFGEKRRIFVEGAPETPSPAPRTETQGSTPPQQPEAPLTRAERRKKMSPINKTMESFHHHFFKGPLSHFEDATETPFEVVSDIIVATTRLALNSTVFLAPKLAMVTGETVIAPSLRAVGKTAKFGGEKILMPIARSFPNVGNGIIGGTRRGIRGIFRGIGNVLNAPVQALDAVGHAAKAAFWTPLALVPGGVGKGARESVKNNIEGIGQNIVGIAEGTPLLSRQAPSEQIPVIRGALRRIFHTERAANTTT